MADLVIRGMEMPKEGGKILIAADGSVWVNAWPTRGYMRMEDVYAVPLPEGHGRLIDAERFRVILCRLKDRMVDDEAIHAVQWAIECLDKLDTIVPAEGDKDNG